MKRLFISLALLGLMMAEEGKWGLETDNNVTVLTDDNFDDFVNTHPFVFVKFYAPWCGHCKKMAPGYAKLAEKMNNEEGGVPIAKLDATVHKAASKKYGVKGFPTLKFFINGSAVDYKGAREEDAIYKWIQKKSGPASKKVETDEQYEKHSAQTLSVLLLLPDLEDEVLKSYQALAAGYDDVSFGHSTQQDHSKKLDVSSKYGFVVFRDFDEGNKILTDDEPLTSAKMKEFLESVRFPILAEFDQNAANRVFQQQKPAMILFSDDQAGEVFLNFRKFAEENKGSSLIFSYSGVLKGFGKKMAGYVGVDKDQTPCVRFITFEKGQLSKFKADGVTPEELKSSLEKFEAKELKEYLKSAEIPAENNEPVKVVVGDSFEDMVLNSGKYVLLEAYAPWCGHCKKLAPIYTDLAEKLAGEDNIVIAKMDATVNEHPSMPVKGFPTLKLFKPDGKPVAYSGDRTLKDLGEFLEKNMDKKFEGLETEEL